MTRTEKLELLEQKLKKHDWYYSRSDDHRMWKRGSIQRDEINNLCFDIGDDNDARCLWQRYCMTNASYPVAWR